MASWFGPIVDWAFEKPIGLVERQLDAVGRRAQSTELCNAIRSATENRVDRDIEIKV